MLATSGRFSVDQILEAVVDGALVDFGLKAANPPDIAVDEDAAPIRRLLLNGIRETTPFSDILGPLYMSIRSSGKARTLGQWFTLQPVAAFMNSILLERRLPARAADGPLLAVCDPCCGSGVQLLNSASAIYQTGGSEALLGWSFTGIDLDNLCAKIAAFGMLANSTLHGIPVGELLIYRGDSLTPPDRWCVVVHATALQVPLAFIAPALSPSRTEAIQAAGCTRVEQLRLF